MSGDLRDGLWHHIAVTVDRDSTTGGKAYVDGALFATFDPTARNGDLSNNQPFLIGQHATAHANDFIGELDEVEIFSLAITGADVASIYNAGSTGKCRSCVPPPANMISWWPGDGNPNDIQNGNNGTLQGGTTYAAGRVGQAFSLDASTDSGVIVPSTPS